MREKALLSALSDASAKHEAAREESERDYAAEMKKIKDKENELISRLRELEEEKLKAAAKYGNLDDVSDDDLVEINAGGRIIVVKRVLIRSIWDALFGGRWEKRLPKDDSGRVFFDINPEAVQYFVDRMNENEISSSEQQDTKDIYLAEFQRINALGDHVRDQMKLLTPTKEDKPYFESTICSPNCSDKSYNSFLIADCLRMQGLGGAEINLLYRGSRDGFSSDDFHSKCDNKGHTLVIIETVTGGIVGGYADAEWGTGELYDESYGDCLHAVGNKAFIFQIGLSELGEHHTWFRRKLKSEPSHAIVTDKGFGPVFGGIGEEADLYVQGRTVTLSLGIAYEGGCYLEDERYEQIPCITTEIKEMKCSRYRERNVRIWIFGQE